MPDSAKLSPQQVYEAVTNRILELLSKGTIPWRKPWVGGMPHNLFSKREYRGVNAVLLAHAGFGSAAWATENQIGKHHGAIKISQKGKWSHVYYIRPNSYYSWLIPGEMGARSVTLLFKSYRVWNIEQTEGLERYAPQPTETPLMEIAMKIADNMPVPPVIRVDSRGAFYNPSRDLVSLPARGTFNPPEEYFSTLFHELAHATGHPRRLGRKSLEEWTPRGTDDYSLEGLVAELGASFLCAVAEIAPKTQQNSAGYLQFWLNELKNDRTLFHKAAGQAQKAADFIRGRVPPVGDTDKPQIPQRRVRAARPRNTSARISLVETLEQQLSAEVLDVAEVDK